MQYLLAGKSPVNDGFFVQSGLCECFLWTPYVSVYAEIIIRAVPSTLWHKFHSYMPTWDSSWTHWKAQRRLRPVLHQQFFVYSVCLFCCVDFIQSSYCNVKDFPGESKAPVPCPYSTRLNSKEFWCYNITFLKLIKSWLQDEMFSFV